MMMMVFEVEANGHTHLLLLSIFSSNEFQKKTSSFRAVALSVHSIQSSISVMLIYFLTENKKKKQFSFELVCVCVREIESIVIKIITTFSTTTTRDESSENNQLMMMVVVVSGGPLFFSFFFCLSV